jgi:F-type H+-transporting ATPase subunit delta
VLGIKGRPDKIAMRYGGVLFDLAIKNNALKDSLKDLKELSQCIEKEPFDWLRVVSPSLPLYTQRKIIESLVSSLKLGNPMSRFLMILCQNRRLSHLNLILEDFLERTKRAEGILEGVLETTFELPNKDIEELEKSLKSQLKKTILLHQEINENLLGGVVLRIGSLMVDRSTRTHLNKLKTAMKG